jgi:hypothetical protein
MRNYFESAEYKQSILFQWNNLTLKSSWSDQNMKINQSKNVFSYWSRICVIYSTIWTRSYDQRNSFITSLLMLVKTSSSVNTSVLNSVIHERIWSMIWDRQ